MGHPQKTTDWLMAQLAENPDYLAACKAAVMTKKRAETVGQRMYRGNRTMASTAYKHVHGALARCTGWDITVFQQQSGETCLEQLQWATKRGPTHPLPGRQIPVSTYEEWIEKAHDLNGKKLLTMSYVGPGCCSGKHFGEVQFMP